MIDTSEFTEQDWPQAAKIRLVGHHDTAPEGTVVDGRFVTVAPFRDESTAEYQYTYKGRRGYVWVTENEDETFRGEFVSEYEPVAPRDLKRGDIVRVRAKDGTTWIPGVVKYSEPSSVDVNLDGAGLSNNLPAAEWDFERRVEPAPEPPENLVDVIDYLVAEAEKRGVLYLEFKHAINELRQQ
jgi:hypothetical protein